MLRIYISYRIEIVCLLSNSNDCNIIELQRCVRQIWMFLLRIFTARRYIVARTTPTTTDVCRHKRISQKTDPEQSSFYRSKI